METVISEGLKEAIDQSKRAPVRSSGSLSRVQQARIGELPGDSDLKIHYGDELVATSNGFSLDFGDKIYDVVIVERAMAGVQAGETLSKAGSG